MKKTIEVAFEIGEKVVIHALDKQHSIVQSIHCGVDGVTYEVAWFSNGDRKTAFVFANELMRLGGDH